MSIQEEMTAKGMEHQMNSHLYQTLAKKDGPLKDHFKEEALREYGMAQLCFILAKPVPLVVSTI